MLADAGCEKHASFSLASQEELPAICLVCQRKGPLSHALNCFNRQLLDIYTEVKPDLEQRIEQLPVRITLSIC